ncbi:MAG TPA: hypothetical protein VKN18_13525 [Blastocatellia bacterium]|nr:hypothetical protein [Blastocatellia bacterium]
MLPLTHDDLLEVLVVLNTDANENVRAAATATLGTLKPEAFTHLASQTGTHADVLAFLCLWPRSPRELVESIIFNPSTPDGALAQLAHRSNDPKIIEAISCKQQSLIRSPEIIDAILTNSARSFEAERRAKEVREEFFEKQFGARMIADEQRAQADAAREAEAIARDTLSVGGIEDLIRLGLVEEGVDDSLVSEYEDEFGPFTAGDSESNEYLDVERLVTEIGAEEGFIEADRIPVFQRVALMSIKDRVMLAIKGTREARMVLIRDPNRIVAAAVLRNPRLTETEVESIASVKTAPEDVLRQIGQNRAWTRSYNVIHNLVRNPRTPIATSLAFLGRIQTRDLRSLSTNKNIPDVIRQSSYRLYLKRSGG